MKPLFAVVGCFFALCAPALADHPIEGTLQGLPEDYFGAGSSETAWTLETGDRTLSVLPTELPALSPEDARAGEPPADTTPRSVPTGVAGALLPSGNVLLSWTPSSDDTAVSG